jgi:ribonuclease D
MKKFKNSFFLVETEDELKSLGDMLSSVRSIAVDLEADSMFHFREKVCLVQIGTENSVYIIDPLSTPDLSSLKPVFFDSGIQKVFHGADYDVRSLYRDFGIEINNLFDTEIASRFLCIKETGLDAVIKKRFGIELDKRFQKKDWSQRPLSDEMLEYAAFDVVFLIQLAGELQQKLSSVGRLEWVLEECRNLSMVRPQENTDEPFFKRFKGAGRLDRRSLAILEGLLKFRFEMAEKRDRPLFKILGNESIMRIVQIRPDNHERLFESRLLSVRQLNMYGEDLVKIVREAMMLPDDMLPRYPRTRTEPQSPGLPQRVKRLKTWRDAVADKMAIDPPLLLKNAVITTIAVKMPKTCNDLSCIPEIKEWQIKLIGNDLIRFLDGME